MAISTEQLLRYEQKRGNEYIDALQRLIRYFANHGDYQSAGVVSASMRDATAAVEKAHREMHMR